MHKIQIRPARKWWAYTLAWLVLVAAYMPKSRRIDRMVCIILGVCSKYGRK